MGDSIDTARDVDTVMARRYTLTEKGVAVTEPWQPGQTSRYLGCSRHEGALSRMDYEAAWEWAALCQRQGGDCVAQVRPS